MSANQKSFTFSGQHVTVSRRFLDKATGRMRVRVTAKRRDEVLWTDFRDFDDMHAGDAAYAKQIKDMERRIEAYGRKLLAKRDAA